MPGIFFVWNELEKDAYFYRNSAMVLLHQFCYFMPSVRSKQDEQVNQEIIKLLETALSMDRRLPFPKKEYLEVCSLDGHVPVDLEGVSTFPEEVSIGCRKHLVYRKIGNMSFGIPGNFLYDEANSASMDHYYDGEGMEVMIITSMRRFLKGVRPSLRTSGLSREKGRKSRILT